jgi:phosphoglycerate dehydrogenase-like enzyme
MVRLARGADALMGTSIRSSPITRAIMESSPHLRIVSKFTIGVDDVDVDAATDLGVLVTHAPTESNWGGVAEGTVAMMLTILKRARERDEAMKAGHWRLSELTGTYVGARAMDGYPGLTVGLVGLGRIGRRVAELLRPWRVRLLACDPYVEGDVFAAAGAERVDLETLLRASDVVSFHVTLSKETRGMINARTLALMKPTSVLINTSRGQVQNEADLASGLAEGTIAAAALDVFEQEPLPRSSPLLKLGHKVLLSAHMVSSNRASGLKPGILWGTRSVIAALRGEVPDNVYNKEVIPRWRQRFAEKAIVAKA